MVYFLPESAAFCLAEAYYQSLANPYEGLIVGDPWRRLLRDPARPRGILRLKAACLVVRPKLISSVSAADTNLPLTQVDLFIDGGFVRP